MLAKPRGVSSALLAATLSFSLTLLSGCRRGGEEPPRPDHPRVAPRVHMVDVTFHSAALDRDMPYRVFLPSQVSPGRRLPTVYLLHGGDGNYRDWSNDSDVSKFAASGLILVMPEGRSSYYVNSAAGSRDRYEDYIIQDLIPDAERRLPALAERRSRGLAGVSMGGYGAMRLAFDHPDLFAFAGAISAALDVPSRPFSIQRIAQWRRFRSIFGPIGSSTEIAAEPFRFDKTTDPAQAPYLYLAAGKQEALLDVNRRFARDLNKRGFRCEFHTAPGGHDWGQWDEQIPGLFASLQTHLAGSLAEVQP
jgi:putative tributyrin esterase